MDEGGDGFRGRASQVQVIGWRAEDAGEHAFGGIDRGHEQGFRRTETTRAQAREQPEQEIVFRLPFRQPGTGMADEVLGLGEFPDVHVGKPTHYYVSFQVKACGGAEQSRA